MSGGAWGYKQYQIEGIADQLSTEVAALLKAVAETEHLIDWAESCDSSREHAEHAVYDLWVRTFNHLYGE